jgi:glutathione S-transferase
LQAFENSEDVPKSETAGIKKDENVERVRRAHLNDLENIPAFLIAGFFYVCSEPNVTLALWLIRVAVLARIGHTIVSFEHVKFDFPFSRESFKRLKSRNAWTKKS